MVVGDDDHDDIDDDPGGGEGGGCCNIELGTLGVVGHKEHSTRCT